MPELAVDRVVVHPLVLLSVVDHFNRWGPAGGGAAALSHGPGPRRAERDAGLRGGRGRAIARIDTPRRRNRGPERARGGFVLGRRKAGARTAPGRRWALTARGVLRARGGPGAPPLFVPQLPSGAL